MEWNVRFFTLHFYYTKKFFLTQKIFAKIFIDFFKNKVYYNNEGGLS